jgi:Tfp pilus assembly protein PilO
VSLRVPLVGLLIAVLLSVAFFFLLYQPRSEEQAALQAETAQLESQQASVRAEIAELERIRSDEPRIRSILARLDQLIPAEVAQPQVLDQFQALSDSAGTNLTSVTFADPVPAVPPAAASDGSQLAVITTSVVLEGGFYEAVDFLRRVEQDGSRAMVVDSVSAAEGEDGFPALTTTVSARLFALLPPGSTALTGVEVAPTVGAPATPATTPSAAATAPVTPVPSPGSTP